MMILTRFLSVTLLLKVGDVACSECDIRVTDLEKEVKRQGEMISKLVEIVGINSSEEPRKRQAPGAGTDAVAFTAGILPLTVDHLHSQQTIKFESVITDIGGGYSNQTGIFTAPRSGIYLFSCSLLDHWGGADTQAHGGLMLHAEIVQNGRVLGRIFAHGEDTYRDQGAQTVFTYANQGDKVFIREVDNDDLGLGGQLYSTFSGYLLMPL
ncbi:complement C1q-like protein 4 [Mya arenaria]|uniref:complement C1q-like protein 4 n=1 Tax=Mya arenaria TaxID=6604 RepID=UPI0022E1331B|nr:complement C1q-like protein 4 [Mya arenaria]